MPQWSPQTYLKFAGERGRPFLDLLNRVALTPSSVVDLGCGPGHLMPVLQARWPEAAIVGVDSSPQMVEQAERENTDPGVVYQLADIADWEPSGPVDLIISNAAFQWVPNQLEVLPRLARTLTPGGVLAFQVPNNFTDPSHSLLRALAADPRFAPYTSGIEGARGVDATTYLDLLAGPDWSVDVWETTYLHQLTGEDAVFDWVSGTGARPFLQALPDDVRAGFETEYKAALREAYVPRSYGTVFPFKRVFVVAERH